MGADRVQSFPSLPASSIGHLLFAIQRQAFDPLFSGSVTKLFSVFILLLQLINVLVVVNLG